MANLSNINGKFVVDTAGNIGVGTLTPRNDANTTNISIQSSGTARLFVNNTGASGKEYAIYSSANGDFGIFDYGAVSARLVINSAGNSTFAGTVQTTQITATNGLNYLKRNTDASLQLRSENTRSGLFITKPATDTVMGSALVLADESYRLGTANYYHMYMLQNGNTYFTQNVGIGVTSPSYKLDVRGASAVSMIRTPDTTAPTLGLFVNDGSNGVGTISVDNGGHMTFDTGSTGAGQAERMRIDSSGNATFQESIIFNNGASFAAAASIRQQSDILILTGGGNGFAFNDDTNAVSNMLIDSGGNVGIGITSPNAKLDVLQETRISYLQGNQYRTRITNTDGNTRILSDGQQSNIIFGTTGLVANGTASEKMRINWEGNVGIGLTTPTGNLSMNSQIYLGATPPSTYATNTTATRYQSFFNSGYGVTSDGVGPYPRYFDMVATGSPDGFNGGSNLRFFTTGVIAATGAELRMTINSAGALAFSGSANYGAAGEVLTSNGNASPSWQAAGGGGSAWPQEKFAEYTIDSTTSNILIATMNSTTWHGNELAGCLKFTINASDYIQVSYITVSTFLSGTNQWFFKGSSEMTTHNNGSSPPTYVFAFSGAYGTFGPTTTLKINRVANTSTYTKVNVLVQAVSSPDMFILN